MEESQQERPFDLRDYWRIVRKRLWLIAAITIIALVTTYIHSSRIRPLYRATAQILIQRDNPQVLKVEEVMALNAATSDYYLTQYKILESRSLAREVIKRLRLEKHPEFNQRPEKPIFSFNVRSALASVVRTVIPGNHRQSRPGPGGDDGIVDPLSPYINAYLGRLQIEPIKNSRLVNISFVGHDPAIVARIANAHGQAYIDKDLELKLSASKDAINWLSGRLEELKKKLQESEEALQRFQEKEDIVALENILSTSKGGEENILAQKLAELNTSLTQARTERIGLETLYRQLKELSRNPEMKESIPYVIQNSLIQRLKGDLIELNSQYSENLQKYGDRHPRMVALREEILSLRSRLATEVNKIAKSVEIQYRMAKARERSLQSTLDRAKKEVMTLNKKAIRYGVLKREVESNRQIYDMILKRAKETSLTSGLKSTNIFIVDKAEVPRSPIRPRVRKNLMMAAAIGLLLGLGLAFFFEYLDNTIHGPDDVKRHLGAPFLGPVGLASGMNEEHASELMVIERPRSNFTESLRNIRTNVVFSFTEPEENSLVITSPGPLEGKTLISCNLAVIMAQMGKRVILVDADMRKPRVHKVFGLDSEPGLSNLALSRCSLEEAVRGTEVGSLRVLPAGKTHPNPAEILASTGMQQLVNQLKQTYDYVIFDSPPILSVTDAAILGGVLDGTVLVVKASETTRESARRALESLDDVSARLLGVVLNQVDFRKDRYNYRYYYKYYYYYTEEGERKKARTRKGRRQGRASSTGPFSDPEQRDQA